MFSLHNKFLFLFIKVVTPVLGVIFIFSLYLFDMAANEKKTMLYEKAIVVSDILSSIAQQDTLYSSIEEFYKESKKSTVLQVQKIFENFEKKSKINFNYYLLAKEDSKIKFLAYTGKKPKDIVEQKNEFVVLKSLSNTSGVEIGYNHENKKVFIAYARVEGTPWGLVISQPYNEYIEPFQKLTLYMGVTVVFVLFILYIVLSYFEKKNTALIQSSEQRFKSLVESTHNWVWEVDSKGVYTYLSKQIENVLGYTTDELIGKSPFSLMTDEEAQRVGQIFSQHLQKQEPIINLKSTSISKNGLEVILLTNGTPFFSSAGELLGYRGIDKDVTKTTNQQKEIEKLAYYDSLTSLANRKTIMIRLEEEISFAKRNNTISALVYLDLDGFKAINDTLGHTHGDQVLKIVATRLKKCIRDFDVASRVGGDEFILLIRGKEKDCEVCKKHLKELIHRLIMTINQPLEIDSQINYVGASIGIAFIAKDGDNADELIQKADLAMYKAKDKGKNCAVFYESI